MKSVFRYSFFLLMSIFFTGCEEHVPDLDTTSFSLDGFSENEEVFGVVPLKLHTSREMDLERVAFFVDNKLVAEDDEAPYEAEWNTLEYEEGEHTVAVEVYRGDVSEKKSYHVIVINNLARITLADQNFDVEEALYAFVTDSSGKAVGDFLELRQEQEVIIPRPEGFNEKFFDLNLMIKRSGEEGFRFLTIITYQGVKAGSFTFDNLNDKEPDYQGDFSVEINNVPDTANGAFYGEGPWVFAYQEGEIVTGTARMIGSVHLNQPMLIQYEDYETDDFRYFLTEPVSSQDELTIDFGEFKPMTIDTFTDNTAFPELLLDGKLNEVEDLYYVNSSEVLNEEGAFRIVYPKGTFNQLIWYYGVFDDSFGTYHFARKMSDTRPDFTTSNLGFTSHSISMDSVSGTANGTFDLYEVVFKSEYEEAGEVYTCDRIVYGMDKEVKISPLTLPQDLFNQYEEYFKGDFTPFNLILLDVESVESGNEIYKAFFEEGISPTLNGYLFSSEHNEKDYQGVEFSLIPDDQAFRKIRERMKEKGIEQQHLHTSLREAFKKKEERRKKRREKK